MALGNPYNVKHVFQELRKCFFLEDTGTLNNAEDKNRFLGKHLERISDTILIFGDKAFHLNLLDEFQMEHCREAPVPGGAPGRFDRTGCGRCCGQGKAWSRQKSSRAVSSGRYASG